MSTENNQTNTNGDQVDTTDNVEIKSPEGVLKKNRELLAKLKEQQERTKSMQEKLDQIEQEKLAQSGKKDELIDNLKKTLKEKDDQLKSVTQTFALKTVNQQVIEAARSMGAEKPDVVMKLADLSDVQVGDDFSVDNEALKIALERVKADVPQLFKKATAAPRDGTPTTQGVKTSVQGMSISELQKLYMEKALGGKV